MTTAVYLRISQDRLGLELGVDRQRADCATLAAGRGWADVREFADNDVSASSGKRRPGYEALMAAVDAGEIRRVVVWHFSRLWRNRRARADGIERFRRAGVLLVAVKGPELDMSTAYGRGMAEVLGAFDTMEVEVHSERAVSEVQQRAERGRNHGGPRAYGYTADGAAVVESEAADVRRWYRELLVGRSVTALAGESGRHHASLRCILLSPRYAGLRVLHGVEYTGASPAIVDPEVWRATVALLTDPDRRTNTNRTARRWLLSGLAGCERCDGRPVGITGLNGGAAYSCLPTRGGCSRRWKADRLDAWVGDLVAARLARPDLANLLPREPAGGLDVAALRTEASAVRLRLTAVAEGWAVGELTAAQLRAATAKLKARLAEIEGSLADVGKSGPLAGLVAADDPVVAWRSLDDVTRRQAVIRALMTITLGAPQRGRAPWNPEAFVRVDWRTA